ncbi:hypothetical protein PR048_029600 [Dryococelus australis]|uniref:Uncharacterized protein n=1 Tax=Dryococelus australis TaxID=614101 RepID=A0ABQ9GDT6_9NEOP|nr:hypothetical protein PR048_029600 [Dryococelus australis]
MPRLRDIDPDNVTFPLALSCGVAGAGGTGRNMFTDGKQFLPRSSSVFSIRPRFYTLVISLGNSLVRVLGSRQSEPGSIPCDVASGIYARVNRAGPVFSGPSQIPPPRSRIPALLHTHLASPSSAPKTPELRGQYPLHLRIFLQISVMNIGVVVRLPSSHLGDPGSVPDFRMWDSCRTMPLVVGFSRGSPVSPVLSFWGCSIITSITLIGFQDLEIKSCLNLPTLYLVCEQEKGSEPGVKSRRRKFSGLPACDDGGRERTFETRHQPADLCDELEKGHHTEFSHRYIPHRGAAPECKGGGGGGGPLRKPADQRHRPQMRKSWADPAGIRTRFTSRDPRLSVWRPLAARRRNLRRRGLPTLIPVRWGANKMLPQSGLGIGCGDFPGGHPRAVS